MIGRASLPTICLHFLWPYLPFPDLWWYIFNYRFFEPDPQLALELGKENLTNLASCRTLVWRQSHCIFSTTTHHVQQ